LRAARKGAADTLRDRGLPNKKTEAWRFTPVRPLVDTKFARAKEEAPKLVARAPSGVTVTSLHQVLEQEAARLEGRLARSESEHFAALNTALFTEGLWIHVAAGVIVEEPLQLIHATSSKTKPGVSYPRVLLTVEPGSEATLIETYAGESAGHLTNSVVEVELGRNAKLDHIRIHENPGFQVGRVEARQEADSSYRSVVVTLGGSLLRFDVRALLQGTGAECRLDGAYLVDGNDHVDHHTLVEHQAPGCRSDQSYRGIASGRGTAVFDGIVVVHRGASKTEAHQENRNLLLSDRATVHTKPHLEIDTDDVICSHGATVGSLDESQLFYLRTRGIPEELARAMLTFAFIEQVIDRVSDEPTRDRLREAILARIPAGEAIRGMK
jgi:Fe-S cluster assembly protein SufD